MDPSSLPTYIGDVPQIDFLSRKTSQNSSEANGGRNLQSPSIPQSLQSTSVAQSPLTQAQGPHQYPAPMLPYPAPRVSCQMDPRMFTRPPRRFSSPPQMGLPQLPSNLPPYAMYSQAMPAMLPRQYGPAPIRFQNPQSYPQQHVVGYPGLAGYGYDPRHYQQSAPAPSQQDLNAEMTRRSKLKVETEHRQLLDHFSQLAQQPNRAWVAGLSKSYLDYNRKLEKERLQHLTGKDDHAVHLVYDRMHLETIQKTRIDVKQYISMWNQPTKSVTDKPVNKEPAAESTNTTSGSSLSGEQASSNVTAAPSNSLSSPNPARRASDTSSPTVYKGRAKKDILEQWYVRNLTKPYMDRETTKIIAQQSGMSPHQLRRWLQNRRNRDKTSTQTSN